MRFRCFRLPRCWLFRTYYVHNSVVLLSPSQITYASASALIVLSDGIPSTMTIPAGKTHFYTFAVVSANADVRFALTALTNDPDIYVVSGAVTD